MRELGYETISGTPGTTAAITVTAVASPTAFPRLSDIAPIGSPVHYTVETSAGQVVCNGVGVSTAAGSFTRQVEFSKYDGTTYAVGGTLASIPAGCIIYCGLSAFTASPLHAPSWNGDVNRWFEPSGQVVGTTAFTATATGRDHFWRFRNLHPHKIDAIGFSAGAIGTLDIGIYEVDWVTGGPGKLLAGWQGVTTSAGLQSLLMTAKTLGALAATAGPLPVGDLYGMVNVSTTTLTFARTISNTGPSGSTTIDCGTPTNVLYSARTNNTSFGDGPMPTGRHASGFATVPMIAIRGA